MMDRRLFSHVPWGLLVALALLFGIGVANLYSASSLRLEDGLGVESYFRKQLVWGALSAGVFVVGVAIHYRHLRALAWPAYGVGVLLLLGVRFLGKTVYGAQRWLDLGPLHLQPTELVKVAVIVVVAKILSRMEGYLGWRELAKVVAAALVPAALIYKQPDLGSALNILLIVGGMIVFKGLRPAVFKTLAVGLPALAPLGWFFLKEYQKQRILVFLDPTADPRGAGYHIIQSQIAIGSGGFWGKGFLRGTQSQLRFLPEKHTDFVFAVLGEEWGFVGSILVLFLFCCFLYQIYLVTVEAKDEFGRCLASGVFFYFFWQILINMGMVLGIMPVVGIPLPFLSYGGSSLLVNFCMVALVVNVAMRRFMFKR
jgi:rod shape determining protein RodA